VKQALTAIEWKHLLQLGWHHGYNSRPFIVY